MRAEPISPLYERARVLHRRGLEKLESEMLSFSRDWSRDVDGSPNRLDAAIWALSRFAKIQTTIPIARCKARRRDFTTACGKTSPAARP
jgi:phage terminase large subunit-like protein